MNNTHPVVSRSEWLATRKQLLEEEKKLTRLRDELSAMRRALPWVEVEERYEFEGPEGKETLADLFDGRGQLVVYHFMFAPEWNAGCKSCSFWADNFNGIVVHLNHRDTSFAAISRAPSSKLQAYAKRLGWSFKWVSSQGNDFNYRYGVSFSPDEVAKRSMTYNFSPAKYFNSDLPGISVFVKRGDAVFHSYSCFARGIDMMNTAYHYLNLTPKGRDEGDERPMSWLRIRDEYER